MPADFMYTGQWNEYEEEETPGLCQDHDWVSDLTATRAASPRSKIFRRRRIVQALFSFHFFSRWLLSICIYPIACLSTKYRNQKDPLPKVDDLGKDDLW